MQYPKLRWSKSITLISLQAEEGQFRDGKSLAQTLDGKLNVMMYIYQSEEAANQLFSFSNPTNRTNQIFQKLFQNLAGGSSYKVQVDKNIVLTKSNPS